MMIEFHHDIPVMRMASPPSSLDASSCNWSEQSIGVHGVSILPVDLPAPTGVLLVERLVLAVRSPNDRDVERLEELMIVLAHEALAAIEDVELHAFERRRDLDRIERLRLLGRG